MTDEYPQREKFFAQRFNRLMTKLCLAQEVGAIGCYLLSVIVAQEDACRYRKPVTYYDTQLMPLIGCKSKSMFSTIKRRLASLGWLHCEAGKKGVASRYWVTIPTQFDEVEDTYIGEPEELSAPLGEPNQGQIRTASGLDQDCIRDASGAFLTLCPKPYTQDICNANESNFETDPHQPPPSPPAFIDPIAEFPETVKTHSRNIYGSYYFRRYGSLPNLSATQTGKDLRELAGRIEAYPFAVERLEAFFAQPPPNIPRTAKLWQIFNHLGLDDDGNDTRTTGGRQRNAATYRPAKVIGNSPMSAGGGQYEGIKPRIASND